MTKQELLEHVMEFFGDKSRSAGSTKAGLLDVASRCESLADSIPDNEDDSEEEDDDF